MTTPDEDIIQAAREIGREWLHAYGIDTRRYTSGGGDHPAMNTLPDAIARFGQSIRDAERGKCQADIAELRKNASKWATRALNAEEAADAAKKEAAEVIWPLAEAAASYDPDEGENNQPAWAHDFPIALLRAARRWKQKNGGGDA